MRSRTPRAGLQEQNASLFQARSSRSSGWGSSSCSCGRAAFNIGARDHGRCDKTREIASEGMGMTARSIRNISSARRRDWIVGTGRGLILELPARCAREVQADSLDRRIFHRPMPGLEPLTLPGCPGKSRDAAVATCIGNAAARLYRSTQSTRMMSSKRTIWRSRIRRRRGLIHVLGA